MGCGVVEKMKYGLYHSGFVLRSDRFGLGTVDSRRRLSGQWARLIQAGLAMIQSVCFRWFVATLVDFYINVVVLAAWVIYKESKWFSAVLWIILLAVFGSVVTCIYIVIQLFKLSPQESAEDPIYHTLLQHPRKNNFEQKKKHSLIVTTRVIFSVLGCLMLGTLLYTLLTDGSPFRKQLLVPWLSATLIHFYINVIVLSVWVAYKESSLISAVFWIILLICFGSITTCAYVLVQLFQLTSQDPLHLVFVKHDHREERKYERPLF